MHVENFDWIPVLNDAIDKYSDNAIRQIERIRTIQIPHRQSFAFNINSVVTKDIATIALKNAGIPGSTEKHSLYVIAANSDFQSTAAKLAYEVFKGTKMRACARINASTSSILYVGISLTPLKRILDHLGFGAKKTYALNLVHWFPFKELPLTVHVINTALEPNDAQALEDAVSMSLNPIFGRKGGK